MKKVLLWMFLVLILSSCSIGWNWEKDKKIMELENKVDKLTKDKENDLFDKKLDCVSNFNFINQKIKNYNPLTIWLSFTLEEVFYSPILNECLYVDFMKQEKVNTLKRLMKLWSNVWWKPLESCIKFKYDEILWTEINTLECINFNDKIKELKWE